LGIGNSIPLSGGVSSAGRYSPFTSEALVGTIRISSALYAILIMRLRLKRDSPVLEKRRTRVLPCMAVGSPSRENPAAPANVPLTIISLELAPAPNLNSLCYGLRPAKDRGISCGVTATAIFSISIVRVLATLAIGLSSVL